MNEALKEAAYARRRIKTLSQEAQSVVTSALTEASTYLGINFIQGQTLLTSIEDAIFRIDSEAVEVVDVSVPLVESPSSPYSIGALPSRASVGRLQRIRNIRTALFGDGVSEGLLNALKTEAAKWE